MKTLETSLTWVLIPLCLGLITYGFMREEMLNTERIAAELIEELENTRKEARTLLIAERTINVEVVHDSDPSTTTYPVIISAVGSFDAEGDALYFSWDQTSGVPVNLDQTGNTSVAQFKAEAGDYEFVLSISDTYGATCSDTVLVSVQPEPNSCPTPIIRK